MNIFTNVISKTELNFLINSHITPNPYFFSVNLTRSRSSLSSVRHNTIPALYGEVIKGDQPFIIEKKSPLKGLRRSVGNQT